MADGTPTLTPSKIWFKGFGEHLLDVSKFSVQEEMSTFFEVKVIASASDDKVDLSKLVGVGAALRFTYWNGDLVWAGLCSEAAQVKNQPQSAKSATYAFTIVPALWRTTLRRNSRVFERHTIPEIVSIILTEWKIPHTLKLLKETYRKHDHRVQYNETDFAFLSRLLEEAGISYYFDAGVKHGAGSEVTSVIFADAPQSKTPWKGTFPYLEQGRHKSFTDQDRPIWDVSFEQRMAFEKVTIADHEMRQALGTRLIGSAATSADAIYEDYQYQPGAFETVEDGTEDPVADDRGKVRPNEEESKARTNRELGVLRHAQFVVQFKCAGIDVAPGDVLAIGQNTDQHHPNPAVSEKENLLVYRRYFNGTAKGVGHTLLGAVSAKSEHRPARRTPKQRILGLQSALVVGPKKQEIYADEYGRVRVQFHWDREGVYDDQSSCWMRVSQGWAGSGFGMVNLPRVGQEVLVSFYDGDPDSPVIVGRLFNQTNKVPYTLPANKTQSGWRSESSGGDRSNAARGYNELLFEDALGKESVALRAERNLSTLVKGSEGVDIGKMRSTRIGTSDSIEIGPQPQEGKPVLLSQTFVGEKTGLQMRSDGQIVLSTTKASIAMNGDSMAISGTGVGILRADQKFHISAGPGAIVFLWGGPQVHINPPDAGDIDPDPIPLGKADPPHGGPQMGAPYYPGGGAVAPPPPLALDEVQVQNPAAPAGGGGGGGASSAVAKSSPAPDGAPSADASATTAAAAADVAKPLTNADAVAQDDALRQAYGLTGAKASSNLSVLPDAQVEKDFVKSELGQNPGLDVGSLKSLATKVQGFTSVVTGLTQLKSSAGRVSLATQLVASYVSPKFDSTFGPAATSAATQQVAAHVADAGTPAPSPALTQALFHGNTDALGPTPSFTPPGGS